MAGIRCEKGSEEGLTSRMVEPARTNKQETTGSGVPKVGSPRLMSS